MADHEYYLDQKQGDKTQNETEGCTDFIVHYQLIKNHQLLHLRQNRCKRIMIIIPYVKIIHMPSDNVETWNCAPNNINIDGCRLRKKYLYYKIIFLSPQENHFIFFKNNSNKKYGILRKRIFRSVVSYVYPRLQFCLFIQRHYFRQKSFLLIL